MFHLKKFCYFLLFRKLLPDLARSLVQTAIDPVFRPKYAKGRGDNWFTKIWKRECHLICSLLYTSVNVSIFTRILRIVTSCMSEETTCKKCIDKYMYFIYCYFCTSQKWEFLTIGQTEFLLMSSVVNFCTMLKFHLN